MRNLLFSNLFLAKLLERVVFLLTMPNVATIFFMQDSMVAYSNLVKNKSLPWMSLFLVRYILKELCILKIDAHQSYDSFEFPPSSLIHYTFSKDPLKNHLIRYCFSRSKKVKKLCRCRLYREKFQTLQVQTISFIKMAKIVIAK